VLGCYVAEILSTAQHINESLGDLWRSALICSNHRRLFVRAVVKVRWSALERCSATYNFSRALLHHLYFSRGELWFKKLRNTELCESAGEEHGRKYFKKGHQDISKAMMTIKKVIRILACYV